MTCTGRVRGQRGASILELAFVTPVMVLIVMGILDLARGYQLQIRLENAAREGAAYAQIYPTRVQCDGIDDVVGHVLNEDEDTGSLSNFQVRVLAEDADGNLTVPVTGCSSTAAETGERVRVEVSTDFDVATPMVERAVGSVIVITGSSEIEVQG